MPGIFIGNRIGRSGGAAAAPLNIETISILNLTPTKVNIAFDLALDETLPSATVFTVTYHTVSSVELDATKKILILTLSVRANEYETLSVVYIKPVTNPLKGSTGGDVASFNKSITNNVIEAELITNPTFTTVDDQPEIIDNGGFDNGDEWSIDGTYTNFAISDGKLNRPSASGYGFITQSNLDVSLASGTFYILKYTVSGAATTGSIFFCDAAQNAIFNKYTNYVAKANGSYEEIVCCTRNTSALAILSTGATYSMDNLSVKALNGNGWTMNPTNYGFELSGDKANYKDIQFGQLTIPITINTGVRYRIKYTISSGGGNAKFFIGTTAGATLFAEWTDYVTHADGDHVKILTAGSNAASLSVFAGPSGGTYSLDDISVEVYNYTQWENVKTLDANRLAVMGLRQMSNGHIMVGTGYVTPNASVYRSSDNGNTFVQEGDDVAGFSDVYDFCDCGSGIWLMACANTGNILRSTNYGSTWTDLGQIDTHKYITILEYLGSGIVIATTENSPNPPLVARILRSTDYGATWTRIFDDENVSLQNMMCNIGGGIIIVGLSNYGYGSEGGYTTAKIARSTDYGENWSILAHSTTSSRYFGSVNLGSGIVIIGTADGKIYRSADSGATFTLVQTMSLNGVSYLFCFADMGGGKIMAFSGATGGGGMVLVSKDYGLTWYYDSAVLAGHNILFGRKLTTGKVLIGTGTYNGSTPAKLFRSANGFLNF